MAKSFKIKSNQIARAIKSSGLKSKLKKKAAESKKKPATDDSSTTTGPAGASAETAAEVTPEQPKVRARKRSQFDAESGTTADSKPQTETPKKESLPETTKNSEKKIPDTPPASVVPKDTDDNKAKENTKESVSSSKKNDLVEHNTQEKEEKPQKESSAKIENKEPSQPKKIPSDQEKEEKKPLKEPKAVQGEKPLIKEEGRSQEKEHRTQREQHRKSHQGRAPSTSQRTSFRKPPTDKREGFKKEGGKFSSPHQHARHGQGRKPGKQGERPLTPRPKLGPTGRHVRDLLPPKPQKGEKPNRGKPNPSAADQNTPNEPGKEDSRRSHQGKNSKFKEFRDLKPKRSQQGRGFDGRDRRGLSADEDQRWRKKRKAKGVKEINEDLTVRPTALEVKLPVSIKDLAAQMKLKASQLIQKLFMQGMVITLNDSLDDETTVLLLGEEFGVTISIDTKEEDRIRITDQSILEEIQKTDTDKLIQRAPVVAFMGHVDHGKTSLIDAIRQSNLAGGEAGAITQHIGAFRCHTPVGDIAILDTPGHEAFSAMRARGAEATDIVVLVVAGDEGMRQQTEEALQHAKAAGVTIIVAINKCDKPNFSTDTVYRQLSEHELLPEEWGGQTITVNTSAVTKEGIDTLLEMLALQAEVLELKANPETRARGSVLESEMHKGMGAVATLLIQNGTLQKGDAVVFGNHWARVKTMSDEHGTSLEKAGPSTPVLITGISGVPTAGEEFIVVSDEKEARSIAEARQAEERQKQLQARSAVNLDNLLQAASDSEKKVLNIILRADVQGSLEALKVALMKIESEKVLLNIVLAGVGEISESDVQLAASSNAVILGFHTGVESHADPLIKQHGVQVHTHDIIYHAIDQVRLMMTGLLDRIAEEEDRGKAKVLATFKSSALGTIAGCLVTDGVIHRNHMIRIIRDGEKVWSGSINSIKRVQDDVREVKAGVECGIVLGSGHNVEVDDILEAYEVVYKEQGL